LAIRFQRRRIFKIQPKSEHVNTHGGHIV